MIIEKKILVKGIDGDSSPRLIDPSAALNIMNCRMAVSENGRDLRNENLMGTELIEQRVFPPYGVSQTIGSVPDLNNNRIIFFNQNSFSDNGIYLYDISSGETFAVLYDSQVVGGLLFDKNFRINRNAKIVGDLLYWTDNLNQPRKINISAGVASNYSGLNIFFETISGDTQTVAFDGIPRAGDTPTIRLTASNGDSRVYSYVVQQGDTTLSISTAFIGLVNAAGLFAGTATTVSGRQGLIITNQAGSTITQGSASVANPISGDTAPYQFPIDYKSIQIIKRPPIYPIVSTKQTDTGFLANFTKDEGFEPTYQYQYIDYEYSALASYGHLVPANLPTDTFNNILFQVPFTEFIDQDIIRVIFCVKFGNNGKTFEIKSYDRNNAYDAAAIAAHNAGTTQLSYDFYNNQLGAALDSVSAVNNEDGVPLLAKTIEYAKGRLHFGNVLAGYDSPLISSLTAQIITGGTTTYTGHWFTATFPKFSVDPRTGDRTPDGDFTVMYIDINPAPYQPRAYTYQAYQTVGTYPSSVLASGANANGGSLLNGQPDLSAIAAWYFVNVAGYADPTVEEYDYTPVIVDLGATSDVIVDTSSPTVFKSASGYRVGVTFYDEFKRRTGEVVLSSNFITAPDRTYATTSFPNVMQWFLNNSNALNEIPNTAFYYSINITKNQTVSFFLEGKADDVKYGVKGSDGLYTFTSTSYTASETAVGVNIFATIGLGYGYVYNVGDLLTLYSSTGSTYQLSVIGQQGSWIICGLKDVGSLVSPLMIFSVYTSYVQQENELFYETGEIYNVFSPTTQNRRYTTTSGFINGDVYAKNSGGVFWQEMSQNLINWQIWDRDLGWANIVDTIGQQHTTTLIKWTDTYIFGSKINGLNKVQPLSSTNASVTDIQKLQLSSKQDANGNIMLIICEHESYSAYLSEVQLVGASNNADVALSDNVIGTINGFKKPYGTNNPESVIEYLGLVFWYDAFNGVFVQYSSNGLEPVSEYKMSRFFKNYSKEYLSANKTNLDNINGFHHVPTCVDPFYKEVIATMPALIYENYATILPTYSSVPSYATSIINRFDIFDRLGKTMAFQYEKNQWGSNYEFMGEWYEYVDNILYGFKNGFMYIHNADSVNTNNFYGTFYPVRICVSWNNNPSAIKQVWQTGLETSDIPNFTVLYSDNPNVQISDLSSTDVDINGISAWQNKEGAIYVQFLRDRISPNSTGTPEEKLYKGDVIISPTPYLMYEFQSYTGLFYLQFINLQYSISRGQKYLLNSPK